MSTFKEWARLSLLERDKEITYDVNKVPNIRKCIKKLQHALKGTDSKIVEKSVTKSHSKESMKAMKFLLQKNAMKLLDIKHTSKDIKDLKIKKPSKLVVSPACDL
jgi:hypothetical protein